jgi:endonuclease/exonuclease/phosphatase family metal-dependent hydrolase
MDYWRLTKGFPEAAERKRVVDNLVALRAQLDAEVPPKNLETDLLLATWNIRDLGKVNRRGYGERQPETYFYIAETLSRFDFVAVQEVNELDEWEKIVAVLGSDWDWIATDVTDPSIGGNGERLTYLWDRRKVHFRHIAGELVLPTELLITKHVKPKADKDDPKDVVEVKGEQVGQQFRRTPFAALFQAAWFKFEICTVHIYYGSESGDELKERVEEIQRVAEFFGRRAEAAFKDGRSLVLLGDFNVVSRKHATMQALLDEGFTVPKALEEAPATNVGKDKYYDQIVFQTRPGDLDYLETKGSGVDARAGSVEIFKQLYGPDQLDVYEDAVKESPNAAKKDDLEDYYLDWRTYQFSDHDPLWVRLKVNDSGKYLEGLD